MTDAYNRICYGCEMYELYFRKKTKDQVEEEKEEALPEVSSEKFYEVDPSFHAMLASKKKREQEATVENEEEDEPMEEQESTSAKPFSLLSLFGKVEELKEDVSKGKKKIRCIAGLVFDKDRLYGKCSGFHFTFY